MTPVERNRVLFSLAVAVAVVALFRGLVHEVWLTFAPLARPWLLDATCVVVLGAWIHSSFPGRGES